MKKPIQVKTESQAYELMEKGYFISTEKDYVKGTGAVMSGSFFMYCERDLSPSSRLDYYLKHALVNDEVYAYDLETEDDQIEQELNEMLSYFLKEKE